MKRVSFRGECFGVTLEPRGLTDKHIRITVEIGDDGDWFEKLTVSSYWLDEAIAILQAAREFCRTQKPDIKFGRQYGWEFSDESVETERAKEKK